MTQEAKNEIRDYLCGPRDHRRGVDLYIAHGNDIWLKRRLYADDSAAARAILLTQLQRLAGLTDAEFRALPRRAAAPTASTPADTPAPTKADAAPETTKKIIRFREKFPFLEAPDCPDVLKILVSDMFTAHSKFVKAHEHLRLMNDQDSLQAYAQARETVESYLENQEIWAELEYYRDHGKILGLARKFREMQQAEDLAAIPDLELASMLSSAKVQESKHRRKALNAKNDEAREKAAAALAYWTDRRAQLRQEVERRKKKPAQS